MMEPNNKSIGESNSLNDKFEKEAEFEEERRNQLVSDSNAVSYFTF